MRVAFHSLSGFRESQETYQGGFHFDQYHGFGRQMAFNHLGQFFEYEGMFKESNFNGHGCIQYLDLGTYYVGNFIQGIQEGWGEHGFSDGKKYIGPFVGNAFHGDNGTLVTYDPDMVKYVGRYENSFPVGIHWRIQDGETLEMCADRDGEEDFVFYSLDSIICIVNLET